MGEGVRASRVMHSPPHRGIRLGSRCCVLTRARSQPSDHGVRGGWRPEVRSPGGFAIATRGWSTGFMSRPTRRLGRSSFVVTSVAPRCRGVPQGAAVGARCRRGWTSRRHHPAAGPRRHRPPLGNGGRLRARSAPAHTARHPDGPVHVPRTGSAAACAVVAGARIAVRLRNSVIWVTTHSY